MDDLGKDLACMFYFLLGALLLFFLATVGLAIYILVS